jgi:hypothetical protein
MAHEKRATQIVCSECGTNPVVALHGSLFCDLCNRYLEHDMIDTILR